MNKPLLWSKPYKLLLAGSVLLSGACIAAGFSYDQKLLPEAKPWTSAEFQFVIIGDRTGGAIMSTPSSPAICIITTTT